MFWFPALGVRVEARDAFGLLHRATREVAPAGARRLSSVDVEVQVEGMRPDLVVRCADLDEVLIEIAVTHFVDEAKLGRIIASGRAAIEVDLSHLRFVDFAQLDAVLFAPSEHARWLHHNRRSQLEHELRAALDQRLIQARADAAAAFAAARCFGKPGTLIRVSDTRKKREPLWIRELEAAAYARYFRSMPEREKTAALRQWTGLVLFPAFLAARCRHPGAFGVQNHALWQGVLFQGLIGEKVDSLDSAMCWLREHFTIPSGRDTDARQAAKEYVMFLKASGLVKESSLGVYRRGVADIGAAAARIVALDENVIVDQDLCWAGEDEWPGELQAKDIYAAFGFPPSRRHPWRQLSCLTTGVHDAAPSSFCDAITRTMGIERWQLLEYLASAGYLRVRALPPLCT